jgi:omega-6 fatty acid desaturase (delta-12 desaturase)
MQRLLNRLYRSGWAPGLYYMVEIWWKRMFFPSAAHMPTRRRVFLLDNLLVGGVALLWARPFVSTTVHLTFPLRIGALVHHIMEHTAHHVDMSIPLYRLKNAQQMLEDMLPGRIVIQRFSWRWYFDTARRCKLYDFSRRCWTDYTGRATSEPQTIARLSRRGLSPQRAFAGSQTPAASCLPALPGRRRRRWRCSPRPFRCRTWQWRPACRRRRQC